MADFTQKKFIDLAGLTSFWAKVKAYYEPLLEAKLSSKDASDTYATITSLDSATARITGLETAVNGTDGVGGLTNNLNAVSDRVTTIETDKTIVKSVEVTGDNNSNLTASIANNKLSLKLEGLALASEVDSEISRVEGLIEAAAHLKLEAVDVLPTENISTSTIYLVPQTGVTGNVKIEYVYVNGTWERIGTTEADLTNYYKKTEVDNLLNGKVDTTAFDSFKSTVGSAEQFTELGSSTVLGKIAELEEDIVAAAAGGITDLTVKNGSASVTASKEGTKASVDIADLLESYAIGTEVDSAIAGINTKIGASTDAAGANTVYGAIATAKAQADKGVADAAAAKSAADAAQTAADNAQDAAEAAQTAADAAQADVNALELVVEGIEFVGESDIEGIFNPPAAN